MKRIVDERWVGAWHWPGIPASQHPTAAIEGGDRGIALLAGQQQPTHNRALDARIRATIGISLANLSANSTVQPSRSYRPRGST